MADGLRDRVVAAVGDLYDIGAELGRGGMSVVYRALDLRLHRQVALKVLPPELARDADVRARFRREAQTAAKLGHPNIVPIHAVDERDGLAYFVMPFVDGERLSARLAREARLPLEDTRRILAEVADALAYAHAHGVVHRDIKPDNILLDAESGRAMVTDFGIARAREQSARLTAPGVVVGTPAYMSPEQAMGETELDARSDIYSLGIVGWQMLAGEVPFTGGNALGVMMKHVGQPPPPLRERRPGVPPALAEIIERALAKAPADRWSDAAVLRDALRALDLSAGRAEREAVPRKPEAAPPPRASGEGERVFPPGYVPLTGPPSHRARITVAAVPEDARRRREREREEVRGRLEIEADLHLWGGRTSLFDRVRTFRRNVFGTAAVSSLFLLSPVFPPFLVVPFYSAYRIVDLRRKMRSLRADGLQIRDVMLRPFALATRAGARASATARAAPADPRAAEVARVLRPVPTPHAVPAVSRDVVARLAPPEVLDGPHGPAIRHAAEDRAVIADVVARLAPADRALLPDVTPTVNGLVERVASLAVMLHRLDASLVPVIGDDLSARIAAVQREPASHDRDRRLELLERQRATVRDLVERRATLAGRMDSAALALRNLRLDLLRLRSSGVDASIREVSHATQEARALSRDIAHVLDAARDVREG